MFWGREVRESFNDSLHSINWNVTSTPAMPFWLPRGGGSISDNTVSIIFPDLVPEDAKLFSDSSVPWLKSWGQKQLSELESPQPPYLAHLNTEEATEAWAGGGDSESQSE